MTHPSSHPWMWRFGLPGWAETVWILPAGVIHEDSAKEPWEKEFADSFIAEWDDDSEAYRALEELHREYLGFEIWIDPELSLAEQIPNLRDAIRDGHLVIWGYLRSAVSEPGVLPKHPEQPRPQTSLKTWIEIVLIDQAGSAVAHEPYRLTLPDGTTRTGALDHRGLVRIDSVESGVCDVSFPRIDAREWGLPGTVPSQVANESPNERQPPRIVRQGEDMTTISATLGFRHWKTVWNIDANSALRQKRHPDLLYPGDRVVCPARLDKTEEANTGARHLFEALIMSRFLRLDLREVDGTPLARLAYQLEIDGVVTATDETDAEGHLEQRIPILAGSARLITSRMTWRIQIADLDPVEHVSDNGLSGALQRLRNLGFDLAPIQGDEQAQRSWTIRSFQQKYGLQVDGVLGPKTLAALLKAHGS